MIGCKSHWSDSSFIAKMVLIGKSALVNYLYEFYIHTFATAKHWTPNSQLWTKDMISATTATFLAASRPDYESIAKQFTPLALASYDEPPLKPARYCRWIAHRSNEEVEIDISRNFKSSDDLYQDFQSLDQFARDPWTPAV